jgi:3-methyladenine DNA glycosylase AlkD
LIPPLTANAVRRALRRSARREKAIILSRFFKTGPGEYGAGDAFLGVVVPAQRKVAREFRDLPLSEIARLLKSRWHEERLTALLILVDRHSRAEKDLQKEAHRFYLAHVHYVNNWDLVDLSAYFLVGPHVDPERPVLLKRLALSSNVWERRIAMVATFHFIKQGNPTPALSVAALLVGDRHDLIHKAVGWMLREVGKRCSVRAERDFLDAHAATLPRTLLRGAIERFPADLRRRYLAWGKSDSRRVRR